MHRNSEGYADPTAGQAMGQLMSEYRRERKRTWQRQYEMKTRPKAYVASAYAGDTAVNKERAAKACRFAADRGMMPVASHLMYPAMGFDDSVPEQREMCCMFRLALLAVCDEVWCFTAGGKMSPGMEAEVREAERLGRKVRYYSIEEVEA